MKYFVIFYFNHFQLHIRTITVLPQALLFHILTLFFLHLIRHFIWRKVCYLSGNLGEAAFRSVFRVSCWFVPQICVRVGVFGGDRQRVMAEWGFRLIPWQFSWNWQASWKIWLTLISHMLSVMKSIMQEDNEGLSMHEYNIQRKTFSNCISPWLSVFFIYKLHTFCFVALLHRGHINQLCFIGSAVWSQGLSVALKYKCLQ